MSAPGNLPNIKDNPAETRLDSNQTAAASDPPQSKLHEHYPCQFGDLLVILNCDDENKHTYLVSSLSLRLASPVWNKCLDPESRFADTAKREYVTIGEQRTPVLTLQGDDPAALRVVLNIIHHRYEEVPKTVTWEQLVDLAVICDKYDTAKVVIPVAHPWVKFWSNKVMKNCYENWLFVGPVFGETASFEALTKKLIELVEVKRAKGSDETVLMLGGKALDTTLVPDKIIDEILRRRQETFDRIMDVFQSQLEVLKSTKSCEIIGASVLAHLRDLQPLNSCSESCLSMAYGYLSRFLYHCKLDQFVGSHNTPNRIHWEGNLNSLFAKLRDIPFGTQLEHMKHGSFGNLEQTCGLQPATEAEVMELSIKLEAAKLRGISPTDYAARFQREYGKWEIVDETTANQ